MAMLLKGKNGNEFELGFVHDSMPDKQDGSGDADWVTVQFRAASQTASWEETAPCLNLFEFQNLMEWLESVGDGEEGDGELSEVELLQPELKFMLTQEADDAVTVRINFHLDNRPVQFNVDAPTDEAEYLDIHIERSNVRLAASELRDMLADIERLNVKDDLAGDEEHGVMGDPDNDDETPDSISPHPPGMSTDADEGYIERD